MNYFSEIKERSIERDCQKVWYWVYTSNSIMLRERSKTNPKRMVSAAFLKAAAGLKEKRLGRLIKCLVTD